MSNKHIKLRTAKRGQYRLKWPPLVNPSLKEAHKYQYDRPVTFDDLDYAEKWISELMNREEE